MPEYIVNRSTGYPIGDVLYPVDSVVEMEEKNAAADVERGSLFLAVIENPTFTPAHAKAVIEFRKKKAEELAAAKAVKKEAAPDPAIAAAAIQATAEATEKDRRESVKAILDGNPPTPKERRAAAQPPAEPPLPETVVA